MCDPEVTRENVNYEQAIRGNLNTHPHCRERNARPYVLHSAYKSACMTRDPYNDDDTDISLCLGYTIIIMRCIWYHDERSAAAHLDSHIYIYVYTYIYIYIYIYYIRELSPDGKKQHLGRRT